MSGFFSSITKKRSASLDGQGTSFSGVPQGTSTNMRFTIQPLPGDTGFSQWVAAMKMVAQLPGGIPPEFRKRLWLTMAERHLAAKGVDWPEVERTCFSEWSHPADGELGVQIVKDLHRTGCSLFCGEDGQENQALLKRVLLAYARWNKAVGYCQGFNMLAALILQVTEKCESDALKLMIYLIEGVLPDSYFADSLRGLSVDMAVFRELLRSRLPRLSKHLDQLQHSAKDGSRSYEPPLTNVFTMQWFLTLFCNCLPHPTVLRVWDLILLEGNEILLRTAVAIWQVLESRIMNVRTADEFYCLMGALTRELLEFDLINANSLIRAIVVIGPLTELSSLREHYLYNINPWGKTVPQIVDKQLKLYPKQNIALDISALKKQYTKLKQRQRQAHIIFSAAITRQPPPNPPVAMNHLLIGKSALVPVKKVGPIKGSIPPARQVQPSTLLWKDTPKQPSSSSSSDTELCDEESEDSSDEEQAKPGKDKQENPLIDNLEESKDVLISTADNTTSAKSSASVELDTASQASQTDTILNQKYESEDEGSDFEHFLADRVKSLGQSFEDVEDERVNFARRNSERALQIIQENSLILHRIMQCQARLSPSPPLVKTSQDSTESERHSYSEPFEETKEAEANVEVGNNQIKHITEQINRLEIFPEREKELVGNLISPVYGSKYTSILEKSKSLDERYNALILNIPVTTKLSVDNFTASISSSDLQSSKHSPKITFLGDTQSETSPASTPIIESNKGVDVISSHVTAGYSCSDLDSTIPCLENDTSENSFQLSPPILSPSVISNKPSEVIASSQFNQRFSNDNDSPGCSSDDLNSASNFSQISAVENKRLENSFQLTPNTDTNKTGDVIDSSQFSTGFPNIANGSIAIADSIGDNLSQISFLENIKYEDSFQLSPIMLTPSPVSNKTFSIGEKCPEISCNVITSSQLSQILPLESEKTENTFQLSSTEFGSTGESSKTSDILDTIDLATDYSNKPETSAEIGSFKFTSTTSEMLKHSGDSSVKTSDIYSKFLQENKVILDKISNSSKPGGLPTDSKLSIIRPIISIDYLGNSSVAEALDYSAEKKDDKEVISPFCEEKYKLPLIDFERFYSISTEEGLELKTEASPTVTIDTSDDLRSSIFPLDSDTKLNQCTSNISDVFDESQELSSVYDDYSRNTDRSINFDRKCGDSPVDDSQFLNTSLYTSSKTCYSYLINKTIETKDYDQVLASPTTEDKSMEFTTCLDKSKSLTLDIAPNSGNPYFKSPVISPLKSLKSPSRSPLKSPSQTFNPFPVPISTRQNKEVPLKLGLYKK